MSSNSSELYLSEGTCYFGAGQVADSHFIPCGNANLEGPVACCYEYDYCLSSNTCWDPDTVVTYIAGCTDPLFRSDNCPQRNNYPGQQWVALAKCDDPDGDLWTGCAHHPNDIQIQKENCDCNKTNVLIQNPNGKESFDEIGRLPNATSEAITYNPTFIPSALPTDDSSGLSTGAKAGIGVGVTIIGLLLIAGAAFFFYRRRKNQRQADGKNADAPTAELGGSTAYGGNEKSEIGSDDLHREKSTGGTTQQQMSELSPQREILEMESPEEHRGWAELGTNASSGPYQSVTSGSTLGPDRHSNL